MLQPPQQPRRPLRRRKVCHHNLLSARQCLLPLLLLLAPLPWLRTVKAEQRSLFIRGPLATEYIGEVASFGDPLNEAVKANLMLPPDNPWLCEYPESLANTTAEDLANEPQFQFTQDIALFVSINRCSAETKARVVQEMRERISDRIRVMIIYSTNPQEFNFVSLQTDDGGNPAELRRLGLLYIPHRYASGIDLRMRMQYQGDDPRFTYPSSEHWNFPIEITELSENVMPRSGRENGYGGDIYWFRVILFSLLIASPCFRACYLWYAGGGRLHWRRNEQGRIVGIQYIPPMPLWLSTGRPISDAPGPVGVLTEDEFNNLPEIVYTAVPETEREADPDDEDSVERDSSNVNVLVWSSHTTATATVDADNENRNDATELDIETGDAKVTHLGTEPDHSETQIEYFPTIQNAKETEADDSERTVENVPLELMEEESNEKEKAGLFKEDESERSGIFGQAKSLTTAEFSRMTEEEIVFDENPSTTRSPGSSFSNTDVAEDPELLESESGNAEGGKMAVSDDVDSNIEQATTDTGDSSSAEDKDLEIEPSSDEETDEPVLTKDAESNFSKAGKGEDDSSKDSNTNEQINFEEENEDENESGEKPAKNKGGKGEQGESSDEVSQQASEQVTEATTTYKTTTGSTQDHTISSDDEVNHVSAEQSSEFLDLDDKLDSAPNQTTSANELSQPIAERPSEAIGADDTPDSAKDQTTSTDDEIAQPTAEEQSIESDENYTTSTSCAICIDEFELGEKLTLLPRCRHAFHRECIHAWLIERQGCCPLCKTDVLGRESGQLHEGDESPNDVENPAESRPDERDPTQSRRAPPRGRQSPPRRRVFGPESSPFSF